LKGERINIGVDTCGYVQWENLEPMLPYIDFFLWDIKHMNPEIHKKVTGVSNEIILSNARLVAERNIPIYIRIPVVPGYNDSEENMRATCKFAQGLSSLAEIHLIPLHHFGKTRYSSLNRNYPIPDALPPSDNTIQKMKELIQSYGLKCKIIT
jgi:pyruvate formate lyase activating enzyme